MKRALTYFLAIGILLISFCAASAADKSPGPVIDLKAKPGAGKVKLDWCKPKGIEGSLTYEVYRKQQGKELVEADIADKNRIGIFGSDGVCISFTDSAVKSGKSYSYAVIVVDDSGNRSVISNGDEDYGSVAKMP